MVLFPGLCPSVIFWALSWCYFWTQSWCYFLGSVLVLFSGLCPSVIFWALSWCYFLDSILVLFSGLCPSVIFWSLSLLFSGLNPGVIFWTLSWCCYLSWCQSAGSLAIQIQYSPTHTRTNTKEYCCLGFLVAFYSALWELGGGVTGDTGPKSSAADPEQSYFRGRTVSKVWLRLQLCWHKFFALNLFNIGLNYFNY